MTYDLTAAVARLRDCADRDVCDAMPDDVRLVLAALEAAQAGARRYRALHEALADNYYCHRCDASPADAVKDALVAIEAAMGDSDA